LLLVTPSETFGQLAPWLIGLASLLLIRPPRGRRRGEHGPLTRCALFAVAIYVGYFGAAGGILMLAVLTSMLEGTPARLNAVKNVLSGMANAVAATGFATFGPVDWGAAVPLALGFLPGGWFGPKIARRLPGQSLRYLAAACGLAVSLKLGYDAYSAWRVCQKTRVSLRRNADSTKKLARPVRPGRRSGGPPGARSGSRP